MSDHIGYITNKLQKFCEGCSEKRFVDENTTGGVYHKLIAWWSKSWISLGFAVLDASETTICKFNVPSPVVGEHLQRKVLSNN